MTQPPVDQPDDNDEATAPVPAPKQRRGSPPVLTIVLGGVLILVVGFFGGIGVSKATGGSGGQQPGAFPSGYGKSIVKGGGGGDMTIGTIERVVGSTVYLRTPDGRTVKVTTTDDTSVRISKPGKVGDLTKGSTVAVRGSSKNGTVSADSIDQGGGNVQRRSGLPTP